VREHAGGTETESTNEQVMYHVHNVARACGREDNPRENNSESSQIWNIVKPTECVNLILELTRAFYFKDLKSAFYKF
jgi:hypothetical protein